MERTEKDEKTLQGTEPHESSVADRSDLTLNERTAPAHRAADARAAELNEDRVHREPETTAPATKNSSASGFLALLFLVGALAAAFFIYQYLTAGDPVSGVGSLVETTATV